MMKNNIIKIIILNNHSLFFSLNSNSDINFFYKLHNNFRLKTNEMTQDILKWLFYLLLIFLFF